MKIHSNPYLKNIRKELRNNLTPPEARLWTELKDKKRLGFKFRRQHSIDNYIVDFYSPKANLIIEVDGKTHLEPTISENDSKRDEHLKELGFKIVRFDNQDILNQLEYVIHEIDEILRKTSS